MLEDDNDNQNLLAAMIKSREPRSPEKFQSRHYKNESSIPKEEIKKIADYLENPTKSGYWRLSGNWDKEGKFTKFVFEAAFGKVQAVDQKNNKRQQSIKSLLQNDFFDHVVGKISPLLYFFNFARSHKLAEPWNPTRHDRKYESFVKLIDWDAFNEQFEDALDVFSKSIYYENIDPIFYLEDLVRLKHGVVGLIKNTEASPAIEIASTEKNSLTSLGEFLTLSGQIRNVVIERVFSPEEDLFEPYFIFLSSSLQSILNDSKVGMQVTSAFDYYKRDDYLHCVSTLGMIGEDYLIQVFETLLREPCPKGLTLGQVFDLLHRKIKDVVSPKKEGLSDLTVLYEKIKNVEGTVSDNEFKSVLRDLVNTIKSDRQYFSQKIDDISKREHKISIFPKQLQGNIDELIRYRNAASHKTRIPIGKFETLRSLYCVISLALWWKRIKKATPWDQNGTTIIQNMVITST